MRKVSDIKFHFLNEIGKESINRGRRRSEKAGDLQKGVNILL